MKYSKHAKKRMEKKKRQKDNVAKKSREKIETRDAYNICKTDEKINWKHYDGTIAGELCDHYPYWKDEEEFYFVTGKAFFVIDERGIPVTCKLEPGRKTVKDIGTSTFYATIIRSVFVSPFYRGSGVQEKILRSVIAASDKTGRCVLAIADPFRLTGVTHKKNSVANLQTFLSNDGYETYGDEDLIRMQSKRFQKLGFVSIDWSTHASITERISHNIYLPDTAPESEKMIVNSIKESWQGQAA
jgi:GNAT superfamily N-acetyltransferase